MDLQSIFGGLASGGVSKITGGIAGISNMAGNAINKIAGNPPNVGSISNFKSSFKTDISKPNRFDVQIPIPLGLILYLNTAKKLSYRCEGASLPGRTFATLEQKNYGPVEKYPYLTTFTDIDLTFIVDDDMNQKVFFDTWMNYINPLSTNNYRYKNDYVTGLTINQYDVNNSLSYSVTLYDAYPISMNQMDLDWSGDGYHKLVVTFAFTSWNNNSIENTITQAITQSF